MNRVQDFFHSAALFLVVLLVAGLAGCTSSNKPALVEKPITAPAAQHSPAASTNPARKLPPPTQAEVQAAFHRVFGDDLIAEFGPGSFIVGDFNGDDSEDLAIIVRPAPDKLKDINSELANWIIQDADKAFIPPPGKRVVVPPVQERPRIGANEEVLAIIHGYGPQGWRSPDARQAYLVKHAAALFVGTAPSVSRKAIRAMKLPVETAIIEQVRNKKKGFLFWTGGGYAWHPSES